MKPYLSLLSTRLRTMLQYRAAAFAGFVCQLVFGLIMIMAYEAFYASSVKVQPMSLPQTVTYIWLGQAFLGLLPWNVDKDFQAMVTSGAIAYELLRPLDLYSSWFIRCLAHKAAATLLRAVPLFLCVTCLLPALGFKSWALRFPTTWQQTGFFLLAMAGVLVLSSAVTTAANISLIWSLSGRGVSTLITSLATIFSGMIVPLPFFPDSLQWLFLLLPFRGVVDAPYRIFMGHIPPAGYAGVFLHQASWIALLVLLGRFLVMRASLKMTVQGG